MNPSASVVPGAMWTASAVVVEGVETSSVASYWAGSDAGRREWGDSGVDRKRRTLLRNRHGHRQPRKRYKVANELLLRAGEDAGRRTSGAGL